MSYTDTKKEKDKKLKNKFLFDLTKKTKYKIHPMFTKLKTI